MERRPPGGLDAAKPRLIEIVRARSFQSGGAVTLASGRCSSVYFNMKPTMLDPEGAYLIASLVLDEVEGDQAAFVGGLEMGAVPIAAAVAAVSFAQGRPLRAFFVRKQAKAHGTKSLIEGLASGETLAGKKVVIVEDVTTTGGSALAAVAAVRAEGGEVVRLVTVVDRDEGASEAFAAAGLSFRAVLTRGQFE